MKRTLLFLLPALFVLSCKKKDDSSYTETITRGSKWDIRIGSSAADVYSRLQFLGAEKGFGEVAVAYRQPFSKPQDIQQLLPFYHAVTLMSSSVVIDRVVIAFSKNNVSSISAGGALPGEISKWPQDAPDNAAIRQNDPVDQLYEKLLAIYRLPAYSSYTLILPDKPLSKPFDPDMASYSEWGFSMSEDIKPGSTGRYSVTLSFKNGKLSRIRNDYQVAEVVD